MHSSLMSLFESHIHQRGEGVKQLRSRTLLGLRFDRNQNKIMLGTIASDDHAITDSCVQRIWGNGIGAS